MSVVGSVTVRVVPSFSGMHQQIGRQFTSTGAQAAAAMSRPIRSSLREAVSSSLVAASTAAMEGVESATRGIASAEEALTKSRLGRDSATARVTQAEERLNVLKESGEASTGQLLAAEADLNKARETLRASNVSAEEAEKQLASAKDRAAEASKAHESALAMEESALYKVGQAFPVIGDHLQGVGSRVQEFGGKISDVGASLTKNLTIPIGGAVAAAGGITAALGWGRLTSLDTAQSQLRGLGYEAEDVERITEGLVDALDGGMMTMADATFASANAMASGVEEGAELTKYIQMLDAAVVGGNGTFEEMQRIFSRVAEEGSLTTREFQMMSDRMPGFSNAIAEFAGASGDELRQMLHDGEITLDDFLHVMEDHAGGMATEYAKTWAGMRQNVMNYVGIIGENILSGVFQRSKEEIGEFIHFLSSDDMADWAHNFGTQINEVFTSVVDTIRGAIDWWRELDGEQRNLIIRLGALAVAAGPVLLVVGKIVTGIGGLISSVGVVTSTVGGMAGALSRVSGIGLRLIPVIGPIIGIFSALWSVSEGFREAIGNIFTKVIDAARDAFERLKPAVMGVWDSLKNLWDTLSEEGGVLDWLGTIIGWVLEKFFDWQLFLSGLFVGALSAAFTAIGWIIDVVADLIGWLQGLGDESTTQGGVWAAVWEWISSAVSWAWENVIKPAWSAMKWAWDVLSSAISWAWEHLIKPAWDALVVFAQWMWENVIQPVWSAIQWAWEKLSNAIMWAWENIIRPAWDALVSVLTWLWENVVSPVFNWIIERWQKVGAWIKSVWDNFLSPVFNLVGDIITWLWENVAKPYFANMWEQFKTLGSWVWDTWTDYIWPALRRFGNRVMDLWNDYIKPALGWISDRWGELKDTLVDAWEDHIRPMLKRFGDYVQDDLWPKVEKGIDMIAEAWEDIKEAFAEPINWVINHVWNDGIAAAFNNVAEKVGSDERIDPIDTIGEFAKGGRAPKGWAIVGEEGPELVNFSNPGRVYTASETQAMLGGTDSPMTKEEMAAATGDEDTPFGIGNWLVDGARWIADNTPVGDALDWVRGKFADTAEKLIDPLLENLSGAMSQFGGMGTLGSDLVDWGVDQVMDWIRGKDEEEMAGGVYDGEFTANPGGFNRPANGPITSPAGQRSYVGRFGNMHYGVDIGVPIGSAIRAAWDGVVSRISGGGMDQTVVLNHGAFDTAYMHNSAITKSVGTQVSGGDVIARSGTAGSGPHLHFELHPGGWYNPSVGGVNSLFRDKGGLVYPGMNMVRNDTGKAEYVFNQQQFENLNRLAEQGGNGSGDTFIQNVHNNGSPYSDGHDFKMHVGRSRRKAGV